MEVWGKGCLIAYYKNTIKIQKWIVLKIDFIFIMQNIVQTEVKYDQDILLYDSLIYCFECNRALKLVWRSGGSSRQVWVKLLQ